MNWNDLDSPASVELGILLARQGSIKKLVSDDEKAAVVFDMVSGMLNERE